MSERIWSATLDDSTYTCWVERTGDYTGQLRLIRTEDPDTFLLDEEVGLMYGAIFGPDVSDVHDWQTRVLEVVDS